MNNLVVTKNDERYMCQCCKRFLAETSFTLSALLCDECYELKIDRTIEYNNENGNEEIER